MVEPNDDNSQTDPIYKSIILVQGFDSETGFPGLVVSSDNGKNCQVEFTVDGKVYRQRDGDRIWPFLKNKVKSLLSNDAGSGITVIDDSGDPQPSQAPTKTVTVFDDSKIKAGSISPSGGMSSSETDKEAQAMGMNAVTVSVLVTFDTATSANPTIKDADLQLAEQNIKDLTAKGYKVIVQPYPWIAGGTVVETQLKPADDEIAWFAMYYLNALNTIAELAEKYKCYGMYIATNLTQLEKYNSMWSGFIKKVKETFTGKIFFRTNWWYDATWDNDTTAAHQKVVNYDFWADVDVIAIAAYFEVTDTVAPTSAQLQASIRKVDKYNRGQNIEQEIKDFHEKWNKPIFFGELGIPPYKTAPSTPWDDKASDYKDATLDYQVQANWYDAWYTVFKDYDWWLGYSVFTIDDSNSLYNPYGHPAADVIKNQFYITKTISVATEDFDHAKQTIAYQVTATNVAHQPVAKPGLLIAKQYGAYVLQEYVTETADVYFRVYTPSKVWTAWSQNTFFN